MLIKLRVPAGPARAEVMQLVDIFRARVVDVSEKTITLAVTGDAGKAGPPSSPFLLLLWTYFAQFVHVQFCDKSTPTRYLTFCYMAI